MKNSIGNPTISTLQILLYAFVISLSNSAIAQTWIPIHSRAAQNVPSVVLIDETSNYLTVRFDISGIYAKEVLTGQGEFQKIYFDHETNLTSSAPGTPSLPQLTEIIRAPIGHKAVIRSIDADWTEVGSIRIYPQQKPLRDGDSDDGFIFDITTYESNEILPNNIASVGIMQGWGGIPVTGLTVQPVRYTPASQQLEITESITVTVDFIPDPNQSIVVPQVPNYRMNRLHQASILNPPPVLPRPIDADENEPVRLLFIMLEEALETAQPLINFHHASGNRSDIWLADEIEDDVQIRTRITEMFEEGLEYVFIIGDGHIINPHVPLHWWDPEDPGEQPDNLPVASHSDSWYVCLDGPDRDGFDDHLPELAIGRLVYETNNLDQLEVQVNKLINYIYWNGENRFDNAIGRALVIADNPTNGEQHDDELEFFIGTKRRISEEDYDLPSPNFIQAFGDQNGITNQFITEVMNEGVGIVNYRGHGADTNWANWNQARQNFGNQDAESLENFGNPFILISSACNTGDIARRALNVNTDCLLETFQKHQGGSVSAHGCIISTWRWANSQFDETVFSAWFNEGIYDLGYSANLASTEMVIRWDASQWPVLGRMNFRTYIWLGDPMLEVKIVAPSEIQAVVPEFVPVGVDEIDVQIGMNGESLPDAQFCIRSENDEIYIVATTNDEGRATIFFEEPPAEIMQLNWMAYHRNGIPIEGEVLVIEGQGVVFGSVRDFANDEAIAGAEIELARFGLDAVTNGQGNFRIEGVPVGEDHLILTSEGFISQAMDVVVGEEELQVDFEMLFSHLDTDREEIVEIIEFGEEPDEHSITLSNSGNGALIWHSVIDFDAGQERFELTNDFNPLEVYDDTRLNGVACVNDIIYIAGGNGNNNGEPNYLYKFSTDFDSLGLVRQPEEFAEIGLRDLAVFGGFVYGSSDDRIHKMVIDEHEVDIIWTIDGPYNPNCAIAVDDEENLFVCNAQEPIVKLDQDGNVLHTIVHNLNIRGLAWSSFENDGFNLYALAHGDAQETIRLYAFNPTINQFRFEADLTVNPNEVAANSLTITNGINPGQISIAGIINHGANRHLRVWNLRSATNWVAIEPTEGFIIPDDSEEIVLTFDLEGIADRELTLSATLTLDGNSNNPQTEIDITLEIGPGSVQPESDAAIPEDFIEVYPNPFNPATTIKYYQPIRSTLRVSIIDISGREITELHNGITDAGVHSTIWDASEVSAGVYFCRVAGDNGIRTVKVVLVK